MGGDSSDFIVLEKIHFLKFVGIKTNFMYFTDNIFFSKRGGNYAEEKGHPQEQISAAVRNRIQRH